MSQEDFQITMDAFGLQRLRGPPLRHGERTTDDLVSVLVSSEVDGEQ